MLTLGRRKLFPFPLCPQTAQRSSFDKFAKIEIKKRKLETHLNY